MMGEEKAFDLSRKAYESWPYMFGLMYWNIFEAARSGIEGAIPQVYMLLTWCRPFFTSEQNQALKDLQEHEVDWTDLYEILNACLEVAQAKGTWEFKRTTYEESFLEAE